MFYLGEEIASGKHVAQTANQSALTGEKVDGKVTTKWRTRRFE